METVVLVVNVVAVECTGFGFVGDVGLVEFLAIIGFVGLFEDIDTFDVELFVVGFFVGFVDVIVVVVVVVDGVVFVWKNSGNVVLISKGSMILNK